jgi:hypothetical protein
MPPLRRHVSGLRQNAALVHVVGNAEALEQFGDEGAGCAAAFGVDVGDMRRTEQHRAHRRGCAQVRLR